MVTTKSIDYEVDGKPYKGFLACNQEDGKTLPGILIAHAWMGLDDFAKNKAIELAKMGFAAFACDVYGEGTSVTTKEEATELMLPLYKDRKELQKRINGSFDIMKNFECVDQDKTGAIGFCFGGLTVLELLRSGADCKRLVSFHGVLSDQMGDVQAQRPANATMSGSILFLHGHDDPLMSTSDIQNVLKELSDSQVDWQFHAYSGTKHAFTNPDAKDSSMGLMYNPLSEKRAWQAMQNFFKEVF